MGVCCSFYCGENPAPVQSVQTHRHQIHMPSSPSTSSVAGLRQGMSQAKSEIVVSRPSHDSDSDAILPATSVMSERLLSDEMDEYEENIRTWPRKRASRRQRQQGIADDNDPARLVDNGRDSGTRLASQHDCKSAEDVFTSCSTDEMSRRDFAPSLTAAAAEILGASAAVTSSSQSSTNRPPTTASYSVHQQYNASVSRFHDALTPSVYPYTTALSSPYNDVQFHRSPTTGTPVKADDGRCAVDVLFDNLYRSSDQSGSDVASPAAVRTFPASPHLVTHSPHIQSYGYHSPSADLSASDSPIQGTPTASNDRSHHPPHLVTHSPHDQSYGHHSPSADLSASDSPIQGTPTASNDCSHHPR